MMSSPQLLEFDYFSLSLLCSQIVSKDCSQRSLSQSRADLLPFSMWQTVIHFCSDYSSQIIWKELGAHLRCVCTCIKIIKYLRGCDMFSSRISCSVLKSGKVRRLSLSQHESDSTAAATEREADSLESLSSCLRQYVWVLCPSHKSFVNIGHLRRFRFDWMTMSWKRNESLRSHFAFLLTLNWSDSQRRERRGRKRKRHW